MANKKQSIKVASPFGFIDDDGHKDSLQTGLEAAGIATQAGTRATKGAASGCKPGSTRHTYVMPYELIDKLKAIAGYFGKPEVGIVLEILEKGVADYEAKYGPNVSDINRGLPE